MLQLIVRATHVTQPEENVRVSEKPVGEIRIKEELIFFIVVVVIIVAVSSSSPKLCNDCRRQCFVAVTIVCGYCLHSHNLRYHRMLTSSSSLSSLSSPPTSKTTVITIVGMDVAVITHQHNYHHHVTTRCTDLYNKTSDQFSSSWQQKQTGNGTVLPTSSGYRRLRQQDLDHVALCPQNRGCVLGTGIGTG